MKTHTTHSHRGSCHLAHMAILGAIFLIALPAWADLSPALDRVSISAGILRADPSLNVNLGTAYGSLGTGDVGLGKQTMPRIKANLMIFDSQGLSMDFYQYKNSYSGSIGNTTSVNNTPLVTSSLTLASWLISGGWAAATRYLLWAQVQLITSWV